jgi:hypothetical protein
VMVAVVALGPPFTGITRVGHQPFDQLEGMFRYSGNSPPLISNGSLHQHPLWCRWAARLGVSCQQKIAALIAYARD